MSGEIPSKGFSASWMEIVASTLEFSLLYWLFLLTILNVSDPSISLSLFKSREINRLSPGLSVTFVS